MLLALLWFSRFNNQKPPQIQLNHFYILKIINKFSQTSFEHVKFLCKDLIIYLSSRMYHVSTHVNSVQKNQNCVVISYGQTGTKFILLLFLKWEISV